MANDQSKAGSTDHQSTTLLSGLTYNPCHRKKGADAQLHFENLKNCLNNENNANLLQTPPNHNLTLILLIPGNMHTQQLCHDAPTLSSSPELDLKNQQHYLVGLPYMQPAFRKMHCLGFQNVFSLNTSLPHVCMFSGFPNGCYFEPLFLVNATATLTFRYATETFS